MAITIIDKQNGDYELFDMFSDRVIVGTIMDCIKTDNLFNIITRKGRKTKWK